MQISLIDDDEVAYRQTMRGTVLPALAQCCSEGWMEPAQASGLPVAPNPVKLAFTGFGKDVEGSRHAVDVTAAKACNTDTCDSANGATAQYRPAPSSATAGKLHYVVYDAQKFDRLNLPGASARFRGAVVVSHGFTEFAEKYSEMVWYFLLAGFSVCVFEHRGHGYSPRDVSNPSLVWIDDWHRYVEDLAKFSQSVGVAEAGDQPLYLFAHSMGGAIGAAVLEQYPDLFHRAVLNAPALDPNTGFPKWIARSVTGAASALGLGRKHAPGQKDFNPQGLGKGHEQASKARVSWYHDLRVADVHYQTNAATLGYTYEFLNMGSAAQSREACARIETPILLFQAGHDVWVREAGEFRFVERVSDAGGSIELSRYDTSCHEIFSMPNSVLQHYLDELFAFLVPDSPANLTVGK